MGWDRILGHARAVEVLRAFASGERTPHAVLIEGPEGVGKMLAAREFAKAVLCREEDRRPCDSCASCRRVESGSHPDLTLIDAPEDARIIRIDSVHALLREAHLKSAGGGPKVMIMPRAERMNDASANAFLKTLEEPPPGTHFVLTAVRARALPPTILSRCARVRMGLVPVELVERMLIDKLGLGAEEAGALAAYSGGSPGRAQGAAGGSVGRYRSFAAERLSALAGAGDEKIRDAAREAMKLAGEAAESREDLTPAEARRVELLRMAEVALLYFRDVHLASACGGGAKLMNAKPSLGVAAAAGRFGVEGSSRAIGALTRLARDISSNCRAEAAVLVACGELAASALRGG